MSRLMRALNVGGGTLHAGFQRLDRVDDEQGTRELYERLAESGVSVNIYGTPAAVPREELYTVHAGEDAELADSWFVVFDGDDAASQAGALVSEETEAGRYSGFWSFQTALVDAVDDYLERTYPVDA
jgi:DICT domain-containing protein